MFIDHKISELPDVIIDIILEYVPKERLIFVNKTYYKLYHHLLKKHIRLYESYVRDTIKRDNEFVFEQILRENNDMLIECRNYRYKYMIFNNYIYFLNYFCIENNSENCRQLLKEELIKRNLYKYLHKKNISKYIKWNT